MTQQQRSGPILQKRKFRSLDGTEVPFANAEKIKETLKTMAIHTLPTEFKGKINTPKPNRKPDSGKAPKKKKKPRKSKVDPANTICVFNVVGKCKNDKLCEYKHEFPIGYKIPICKLYHSWFKCRWGDECVYAHEGTAPEGAKVVKPAGTKMPVFALKREVRKKVSAKRGRGRIAPRGRLRGSRGRGINLRSRGRGGYGKFARRAPIRSICFSFQKGRCNRGSSCDYMHMHEGSVGGIQPKVQNLMPAASSISTMPMVAAVVPGVARAQPYPAAVQIQPYQQVVTQQKVSPNNQKALPAGWSSQFDPTHKINYYFNLYTGKSQWEEPTKPALPSTTQRNPANTAKKVQNVGHTQRGATQQPTYVQAGQNAFRGQAVARQRNLAFGQQLQYHQPVGQRVQ